MKTDQSKRMSSLKPLALLLVLALLLASFTPVSAKSKPVRVKAIAGWVDTKVWVEAGQRVSIKAKGIARTAPVKTHPKSKSGPAGQTWGLGCSLHAAAPQPCALNGAPYGALVGRIGSGAPFLIGASKTFIASSSGYLRLAVNDNLIFYNDNKGGFSIQFK